MCAQRYHPEVRMSFHQCMMSDESEYEYIEENMPGDSDIEEFDKEYEIVEYDNEASLHQTMIEDALPEEVQNEIDHVQFSFHASCFEDANFR